jgi:Xaa-Pro aminopeptidase
VTDTRAESAPTVTATRARTDRLRRAQAAARAAGVDALLVTPGPDLTWLTGYDAVALERLTCLVLPASGDAFLVCPRLELSSAAASPAGGLGIELAAWEETEDPYRLVADRLGAPAVVGVANRMWAEQVLRFRAVLAADQVPAGLVLADLRARKDDAEVAALRDAGQAIDRVHLRMGEWLRPGRTERAVGRDIAQAILDEGHDRVDFTIVAGGPNGASPHHETGDRVLERGDVVVVDIGGTHHAGYCSDCTRTYVLGEAPADFRDYYAVLLAAQVAACEHAGPGVTAESVDRAARDVITQGGYGAAFLHRTGHGIGVETHEEPYIVAGNSTPLAPGNAFSIEPGIYLPGRFGLRLEDIVVATPDGPERLNQAPRDLAVVE